MGRRESKVHRRGVLVLGLISAVVLSTSASATVRDAKAPRFNQKDACSLPTTKDIKRLFGGAVTVLSSEPNPKTICLFGVAPEGDRPGGELWSVVDWRRGDDRPSRDAYDAVARAVDPDIAGGLTVEELAGLGKQAYLYPNDGSLFVVVNKDFAFHLFWDPNDDSQQPVSSGTAKDTRALLDLARTIVKRAS